MTITLRAARGADGRALQEIERRAGERFRDVGMGHIADADPVDLETLAAYAAAGRSWVAVGSDDGTGDGDGGVGPPGLVGYVVVDVVDGCAHVEQVSVVPAAQGRGVGRALLDRVAAWAAETGRPAVTLTTFADVPFNRPLYEHLGYRALAEPEIGPELRALRATEAADGLDPALRVCMRLEIGQSR